MDKDLQALIEESFQDRQLQLSSWHFPEIQLILSALLSTHFEWSAPIWEVLAAHALGLQTQFIFVRFCSGSRHSVGCLLMKLPGGQHHEAFARAGILTAFSSRRSHEDLIKSYCIFFLFQVLHVTSSYQSSISLEWNFLTPPHDAAKDHCQSDADLVARLKAFQVNPPICDLLVDEMVCYSGQ